MRALILAMGIIMSLGAAFADCALVKNNLLSAQISVAENADANEKEAAKILREILEFAAKDSGYAAQIGDNGTVNIALAINEASPTFKDALKNNFKKRPCYRFTVCDNNIKILYPETQNAVNAVGFFLQKIGFRFFGTQKSQWLVPQLKSIKNFDGEFTPAFASAHVYTDNPTPQCMLFLKLNGNNPAFGGFGHNLQNIFPKKLLKTSPQFRASIKACNPENLRYENPNFLSDAAAYRAADYAEKYFSANPDKLWLSLSICDDANFDESLYPQSAQKYFFRNAPDKSGEVFYFTNKAAKIVSRKFPDRYLGCLAYLICEKPPSFGLEKNLIPIFTTDRENYFDESYKRQDFDTIAQWGKKSKVFGIYDYAHGTGYAVPHNIENHIFEGMDCAYKNGAKIYFGEYTPFWEYDNFKMYAVLKKLNFIDADLNEIKREFFGFKYGKAAPFVMEFFDAAQNVWASQKRRPRWLGTYLKESTLALFDANTIGKMQLCIEKALNTPNSPKAFLNVYELSKAFEFTKASVKKFELQQKLCNIQIKDKASAKEALKLFALCEKAEQRVLAARQNISSNGKICKDIPQITWPIAISKLAFAQKIKKFLADGEIEPKSETLNNFLKIAPIEKPLFYYSFKNKNAGAQAAFSPMPKEFLASYKVYENMRFNLGEFLQIAAAESVCLSRYENAAPGKSYLFKISAKAKMQIGSQWSLFCLFLDKNNKVLKRSYVSLPSPCNFGDFREFAIAETAPKGTKKAGFQLSAAYMKEGDEILVGDFSVFVSQ